MKKIKTLFAMMVISCGAFMATSADAQDFGDMKSYTLVGKAWAAAAAGNHEHVLAYTNKCIDMYLKQAKEQQAGLTEVPKGAKEEVFKFWALNDVGVSLFIKGNSLVKNGDNEGAIAAYKILVEELKFAQCWDTKGWFWQPAGAAKSKMIGLSSGF